MKPIVLIKVSLQSILKNKMRSLLTMLGIIIGVSAVIVMVSIGQGAQQQIEKQINNLGTNMIVITPGSSQQQGVSRGAGTSNSLTLEDMEKLKQESMLLTHISPVIFTRSQVISNEGNWRASVLGVNTDYLIIRDWPLASGLFFTVYEERAMRKVAVLGATIAKNLFPDSDPVGQEIRIRNVPLQVIGVLTEKGQSAEGNDQDDVVLAPYLTVQNRLSGWSFIGQILISAASPDDIPHTQQEVRSILRESHRLSAWEEDDFTLRNQTDLVKAASGTTEIMSLLLAAIAGISLVVGGIGIMNIMLVSVTERTKEIGIRMSMGARGSDILVQFLVESTVMCLIGGVMGMGLGFVVTLMLSWLTGWSMLISIEILLIALIFSGTVGIFFGFYPARKAAALNPIEALRYE